MGQNIDLTDQLRIYIYKFFAYLAEAGHIHITGRLGPRQFALGMMALGIIALQVATFQHRHDMAILHAEYGLKLPSLAAKVAIVISITGTIAWLLVIFRQ